MLEAKLAALTADVKASTARIADMLSFSRPALQLVA